MTTWANVDRVRDYQRSVAKVASLTGDQFPHLHVEVIDPRAFRERYAPSAQDNLVPLVELFNCRLTPAEAHELATMLEEAAFLAELEAERPVRDYDKDEGKHK
jgi:hypothetical protein